MSDSFADDLIGLLPNLRRFAISLCRSRDVADDLVQLTAEKAFAARERFDSDTRLDAWLFRILRNTWIDMVRQQKNRGTQIDIDDAPDARTVDGTQTVETSLMLQAARQAIDQLPDDQRDVMVLICVEELSYKEAAEVLEVPMGTVMSRLARARLAVAEKMGINSSSGRSTPQKRR